MSSLLKDLLQELDQPGVRPIAHERFHGYRVRKDRWGVDAWNRNAEWHVLHVMQAGEIRFSWRGESRTVTPGQAVVFGAASLPRVRWSDHVEEWDLWFKLEGAPNPPASYEEIIVTPAPAEAASLMEHSSIEVLEGREVHEQLFPLRFRLLLAILQRAAEQESESERKLTPYQRIRLVRWTQEHLAEAPSPQDLAEVVGLTPDYFARLFRATFDRSPRDWLVRERIQTARRLIDLEGVAVADAMSATGFRNTAHFFRLMKRMTGRTPGGRRGWKVTSGAA